MAFGELLEGWLTESRSERAESIRKVDAFVQDLQVRVRRFEQAAPASDERAAARAALDSLFDTMPAAELDALIAGARSGEAPVLAELRQLVARIRESPGDLPAGSASAVATLLGTFRRVMRRRQFPLTLLKLALYAVPLAAAYLIGTYFRLNPTLYFEHESLQWPHDAYVESGPDRYDLDAGFQKRFLEAFARYYFDRDRTAFPSLVERPVANRQTPGEDTHTPTIEAKFVFKNPSRGETLLVSTVRVSTQFEPMPFPWDRLDVKPDLTVKQRGGHLVLEDTGIGPALAVAYEVTLGKDVLLTGSRDVVHRTSLYVPLDAPEAPLHAVDLRSDKSLVRPMYVRRDANFAGAKQLCPGEWFQTVVDLTELRTVTNVNEEKEGGVAVRYMSLRDEPFEKTTPFKRPAHLVYVRPDESLMVELPCVITTRVESAAAPSHAASAVPLLAALLPPDVHVQGVDLLVTNVRVELREARSATINPDTLLNRGGSLVVYAVLARPQNGRYTVTLSVNNKPVRTFTIQSFAPEPQKFNPSQLGDERKRFARPATAKPEKGPTAVTARQ